MRPRGAHGAFATVAADRFRLAETAPRHRHRMQRRCARSSVAPADIEVIGAAKLPVFRLRQLEQRIYERIDAVARVRIARFP